MNTLPRRLTVVLTVDVPADVSKDTLNSIAQDAFVQVNEPVIRGEDGNETRVPTLRSAAMTVSISYVR